MDLDKVKNELLSYIRVKFEIPEDDSEFTSKINLFDYGYIDSFGSVDIYAYLEKQYQVSITEEVLSRSPLKSVDGMVEFVSQKSQVSRS